MEAKKVTYFAVDTENKDSSGWYIYQTRNITCAFYVNKKGYIANGPPILHALMGKRFIDVLSELVTYGELEHVQPRGDIPTQTT